MVKISVITPSVRPEGLEIVRKCLRRQDFEDYEWIIATPEKYLADINSYLIGCALSLEQCKVVVDPPKNEGDFWTLCKGWNNAYAHAKGELIVNIQDLIYVPPDTLSRFWSHYTTSPKALVTAVGNHYSDVDLNGKPINVVWQDPRMRSDEGSFYEITPSDMEMSVCSVPRQAILDCGGVDEEYDKGPGVQEKEMCFRLKFLGYQMFIDQGIEYRAIKHGRLTEDWDEKYWGVTAHIFERHMHELLNDERTLNVHCLERYNKETV